MSRRRSRGTDEAGKLRVPRGSAADLIGPFVAAGADARPNRASSPREATAGLVAAAAGAGARPNRASSTREATAGLVAAAAGAGARPNRIG